MPDIVQAFRAALADPHALARWELAFGFPFAGVDNAQSLSLHLTRHGGEIVAPLAGQIPAPYERGDAEGSFRAAGRSIRISRRRLHLGIRAADYTPPPYDGGVQDALLLAVHGCALRSVSQVVSERFTDTHFEEPPPRARRGPEGREFLRTLVTHRAVVRLEVTHYWHENVANPELRLVLDGPLETVISARMGRPSRLRSIPDGTYRCRADAYVHTFPGYRQTVRQWSHETLWTSEERQVTLEPGQKLVARAFVPPERLRLTDEERALFSGQIPPPDPRTNVELALDVERAWR
jgi:hypothetical protein